MTKSKELLHTHSCEKDYPSDPCPCKEVRELRHDHEKLLEENGRLRNVIKNAIDYINDEPRGIDLEEIGYNLKKILEETKEQK